IQPVLVAAVECAQQTVEPAGRIPCGFELPSLVEADQEPRVCNRRAFDARLDRQGFDTNPQRVGRRHLRRGLLRHRDDAGERRGNDEGKREESACAYAPGRRTIGAILRKTSAFEGAAKMCNHCHDLWNPHPIDRRRLLAGIAASAAGLVVAGRTYAAEPRALALYHTHTRERLRVTYAENGAHIPEALDEISHFLRDFRTGDVHPVDPGLLDVLHHLRERAGGRGTFEIISAYRSPRTNEMLRRTGGGGVAKRSLHMEGKAIDVRLTSVRT